MAVSKELKEAREKIAELEESLENTKEIKGSEDIQAELEAAKAELEATKAEIKDMKEAFDTQLKATQEDKDSYVEGLEKKLEKQLRNKGHVAMGKGNTPPDGSFEPKGTRYLEYHQEDPRVGKMNVTIKVVDY